MAVKETIIRNGKDGTVMEIQVEITHPVEILEIYKVTDSGNVSVLSEWNVSGSTATKIYTTKTKELLEIPYDESSNLSYTIDVNPETLYSYCGSKCKHPIYTMKELDDKFDTYFLKGNFAKLTGTVSTTDDYNSGVAYGSKSIDYPTGFTRENCFVVGAKACITPSTTNYAYQTGYGTSRFATGTYKAILNNPSVELSGSGIKISAATDTPVSNIPYEILLLKYED